MLVKWLKSRSRFERWMFVCVALAVVLRVVLIAFNWPYTDSDEGNMGVLAMHVAFRGEHPIFFYGANYLGPLEGYLAAPLFRVFGSSLFLLRLPLVLCFAIFLLGLYYLLVLLYKEKLFALVMVALLGLGSQDVLFLQLRASGEYPELEMFAVLICLLGLWLALTLPPAEEMPTGRKRWLRIGVYLLLGILAGLAIWVDVLAGPFVLGVVLLLYFFNRRELKFLPGLSLIVGLIIGAFPLIYYNLTAPWYENSLFVFAGLDKGGTAQMQALHLTWIHQLSGMLFISLPMATSGGWGCTPNSMPAFGPFTPAHLPCIAAQGTWSIVYIALAVFAGVLAFVALRRYVRGKRRGFTTSGEFVWEERQEAIRQYGRLMLLACVGLTLLLYTISPQPAVYSDTAFRYLTCLYLAWPILLWPLWQGISKRKINTKKIFQVAILLFVAITLFGGTINTLLQMPTTQARYEQQQRLIQDLENVHATRLYSDYWTCNILIFLSKEKIICSALGTSMQPAQDRYWPYHLIIQHTPHPGYIFFVGSPEAKIMQQRVAANPSHYRVYQFEGYMVYQQV